MVDALRFVAGDEVVEPFLLETTDGNILDLATVTITGAVWWREYPRFALTVGVDIAIENLAPARAVDEDDQQPHGRITLNETQTPLIPLGQIAYIRLVAVRTADDVTMSTYLAPLERII